MGQALRAAGAAALDVNAPMGPERLSATVAWVAASAPADVADLGCGRGALAVSLARALGPGCGVIGIDLDADAIAAAVARAEAAGVSDRCTFVEGDVTTYAEVHAATTCVGTSHAFGGARTTLDRMLDLTRPGGVAVLGDGVWATTPDQWCRETFGDLPTRNDVVATAGQIGWIVDDVDESTLQEWDDFEAGWSAGVEAVGSPEARAFAEERRGEYGRYRGVLGFAWLLLRKPS